jgi:hypothetical protein
MGTTASASDPVFHSDLPIGSLLAGLAALLLVLVSLGVIYLSTIEWRDRRRRSSGPSVRS